MIRDVNVERSILFGCKLPIMEEVRETMTTSEKLCSVVHTHLHTVV